MLSLSNELQVSSHYPEERAAPFSFHSTRGASRHRRSRS
jgi:hypothetical protein